MKILFLSERDIQRVLDVNVGIESQRFAYAAAATSQVKYSAGLVISEPADDGAFLFAVTGAISGVTGVTCKFGLQVPSNLTRGLPSLHAFVTISDADTGENLAIMNGTTITTIRTACGVAAAADILALNDASLLSVIGSGVQAREAVRAISAVRKISAVRIWSPSGEHRRALSKELANELGIDVQAAGSAESCIVEADIVVTCTLSKAPVLRAEWLAKGCTLLTVGSFEPDRCEIGADVLSRASGVFVDDVTKALANCGPVITAVREGVLDPGTVVAIGDVITHLHPGRASSTDTLVFHSLGIGAQDAALSWRTYEMACEAGIGQWIEM